MRFTQTKSSPGTGFSNGLNGRGRRIAGRVLDAGSERRQGDALLLERVGGGVALARAGAAGAADVGEVDALGQDLREAARHHLPGAHVAPLLLDPGDLLQV